MTAGDQSHRECLGEGTENSQEVAMKYDREPETRPEGMTHEPGRRALLTGAASAVLLVAALGVLGETPSSDESVQHVVAFYSEHASEATSSAMLSALGAVLFLFFVGGLGSVLQRSEGPNASLAAARAGGAVAAVGMLILAGLSFTLGEASAGLEPAAVQTLNALNDNFFFPLVGGMAAFLLATGLAMVRSRALPQWLGWLALAVGVAVFTPLGPVAFLASLAWVLLASIVLAARRTTSSVSAAGIGAER